MRLKMRVMCPACLLLIAVLICGYFRVTSQAASVNESQSATQPVEVSTEVLRSNTVNAPNQEQEEVVQNNTVNEVLLPPESVMEPDEEPSESSVQEEQKIYELTDTERIAVECAVMAEAGGEGPDGQMMVAQSILDGAQRHGYGVIIWLAEYEVATTGYGNVTDEVKESVSKVFDQGIRMTVEKTDLWYNPAIVTSAWHEQQHYVITVGSHRFFWMNG